MIQRIIELIRECFSNNEPSQKQIFEVSMERLPELIDSMKHSSIISDCNTNYIRLLEMWEKRINEGCFVLPKPAYCYTTNEAYELSLADYLIDNITIIFSIDGLQRLILDNKLANRELLLSSCIDDICYTEYSNCFLHNDALETPIIVVMMPSIDENGCLKTGRVVDGNHRISAAVSTKVDIPVTFIEPVFIPPMAFVSAESWALYNIVIGIKLVAGEIISPEQQEKYLLSLNQFLPVFLPYR